MSRRWLRPSQGRAVAAVALAMSLAGCNALPPPVDRPVLPAAQPGTIFVSRGDTLYSLARQYRVSTRDLIEANGLVPPYMLNAGQKLIMPMPLSYEVKAGDTVYGLSRRFNVDMNELVRLNDIQAPYMIQVGQQLRLPRREGPAVRTAATLPPAASATVKSVEPHRQAPATPTVTEAPAKAGRPGAGTIETAELPPLPPAQEVPPTRPPQAPSATVTAEQGVGAVQPASRPPAQPSGLAPGRSVEPAPPPAQQVPSPAPPASRPAVPPQVAATPAVPPAAAEQAPPPSRAGTRFAWPLLGQILSEYGPKPGGLHNDGINIAGVKGAPVLAADNGVVAYAGNELRGFGNLLLVRHADGFVTAYAHLENLLVERGQTVTRGQPIGTVGQSGNVRSPQLHFEVRKGSRALDPREYLEKGGAPRGTS